MFPTLSLDHPLKSGSLVSLERFDNFGDDFAKSMVVRFVPADNVVENIIRFRFRLRSICIMVEESTTLFVVLE